MAVKIFMLFVFFGLMIAIGWYSRHQARTVQGYVLGGRSVGPWISAFAYGTSYFSAVVFVGYAGQFGWKYGLASTWIGIGNAFIGSLLAWVILGRRTRVMTKHLNSATMPAFFESRYSSSSLKIVASAIIFIFLIPYTASVYNGLSNLFEMAFGIPYIYCVIMMAALTCVYVLLGGYTATVYNDFVQGIIMLVGIVAVILAVLNGHGGFLEAVKSLSTIPSDNPVTAGQQGAFASFFGPDPMGLMYVIILTSLGTWGLPQMVQKFYAIKSEKAVATGTIVSTFFAVVIAGGSYFLGGFARLIDVEKVSRVAEDGTIAMMYDHVMPELLTSLRSHHVGFHVNAVLPGPHVQLDTDTGFPEGHVLQENERTPAAPVASHPCHFLHRDLCRYGDQASDIYRTAHGYLLGRSCRSIPCTVPVRTLLEARYKGGCLGFLYLRCRPHSHEYLYRMVQSDPGRRDRNARRPCDRPGREYFHPEDRQGDRGRDLCML